MARRKKSDNMMERVGAWAFIAGVVIALVSGFWPPTAGWTSVLIVLGLAVGFLNVTKGETNQFLFTALVLVVMAGLGGDLLARVSSVGEMLRNIFSSLVTFVIPAAVVVALKTVYSLAHD